MTPLLEFMMRIVLLGYCRDLLSIWTLLICTISRIPYGRWLPDHAEKDYMNCQAGNLKYEYLYNVLVSKNIYTIKER